jgi:hypothetical protein
MNISARLIFLNAKPAGTPQKLHMTAPEVERDD